MAKKQTKHKLDVPEDWEVHEEEAKEEKKKRQFQISNNMLWVLFIIIFIAFVSLAYVPGLIGTPPKEMQTEFVDGIRISAPMNPIAAVQNLPNLHIQGKHIEETEDTHNALNEIFVVVGQQGTRSSEGVHTLLVGVTDRTGIFIDENTIRVEGASSGEFWKAVWTLNSIISGTGIDSVVDLFKVQNILKGRENVYLVQDVTYTCSNYASIISAEGDILPSLGLKQAQYGFELLHYQKDGASCTFYLNGTETQVECPIPSETDFVITMKRGDSNLIDIKEDEILFQYARCDTVDRISVILRDILYPYIISALSNLDISPTPELEL